MHLRFDLLQQLELGGLVLDRRLDHDVGALHGSHTGRELDPTEDLGRLLCRELAALDPTVERLLDFGLGPGEISGSQLDALDLEPGRRRDFHDTPAHHAAADHSNRCNTHENLPLR
jgi:hypothetical protein